MFGMLVLAAPLAPLAARTQQATDAARVSEHGKDLLAQYGCGACHVIPGVDRAVGRVGPSLATIGHGVYIAGSLPNTPDLLAAWIRTPQTIQPRSGMPNLGVSEPDARAMVAYFYALTGE